MGRRRVQADCKADTRGGRWAGIPVCVIESAAYRHSSVHARAILVELVARMMGYNNGRIAVSQRQLVESLACAPRKVVRGIAELMEHGLIDVQTEGKWKERMAREYRLTFVTTKGGPATNDYLRWKPTEKSGVTTSVAKTPLSASTGIAGIEGPVSAAVTGRSTRSRKTANPENRTASGPVSLIPKPYVGSVSWWTADHCLRANRSILAFFRLQTLRAAT